MLVPRRFADVDRQAIAAPLRCDAPRARRRAGFIRLQLDLRQARNIGAAIGLQAWESLYTAAHCAACVPTVAARCYIRGVASRLPHGCFRYRMIGCIRVAALLHDAAAHSRAVRSSTVDAVKYLKADAKRGLGWSVSDAGVAAMISLHARQVMGACFDAAVIVHYA